MFNTKQNEEDIRTLVESVESSTLSSFVTQLKRYDKIIYEYEDLIDFDWESLTASLHKHEKYLTGCIDCYDDEGQWIDTIRIDKVYFQDAIGKVVYREPDSVVVETEY